MASYSYSYKMVNTFLVCADYRRNMKLLDKRRLGKQRLEARDIYERIVALRRIYAWYCKHPPKDESGDVQDWRKLYPYIPVLPNENTLPYKLQAQRFSQRVEWTKTIAKLYLNMDHQLIIVNDSIKPKPKAYKCGFGEKMLFTKRHAFHPALGMWMGYEESLKLYYNVCIQEWMARGCKNTMPLYEINDEASIVHPWWTKCLYLHNSHKGALLRKELVRHEKDWYWIIPEVVGIRDTAYYPLGYCWPSQLTTQIIELMLSRHNIPPGLVCAPVFKDFVAQSPYLTDKEGYVIVECYC